MRYDRDKRREKKLKLQISSSFKKMLSVLAVSIALFLTGCEAPLVLDGVEQSKRDPIRRSDSFQSVVSNGSALLVVGDKGVVLSSTDNGASWTRAQLENSPFLMDAVVCPDKRFVALDYQHNVWFSDVTGTQWQAKKVETFEAPQAISCDSQGRLWIVGGFSSILRSDDGGDSWEESSMDEDLHFTTVQFVDADHGLLMGEFGVVARTVDGGQSWEMLEPIPDEFYPQDAWFQTMDRGWVVGLNGTVLYTEDGASTWQSQETGTKQPIYSIAANGDSLYAVGGNGLVMMCKGCIGDLSGATGWERVDHGLPIRFYLRGLVPVDDQLWIAGGAGALHSIALAGSKNKSEVATSGEAE